METKICTKCGQERPIEDFYWKNKAKGLRRSECKDCHNNYVKNKYKERHDEVNNIKSQMKCVKCGQDKFYLLDFHHINPEEKDNGIAQMLRNNTPWEQILSEMKKCIPLCANCHREFHYLEQETKITLDDYLKNRT